MSMDRETLAHLRHELRTPLNHIIGYSEMLLEDVAQNDPGALKPGLIEVHENAQRLLKVINDLVRADAGHVDLANLSMQLSEPLRAVIVIVADLTARAAEAGVKGATGDLARIAAAATQLQSVVADGANISSGKDSARKAGTSTQTPQDSGGILVVDDNDANREMLSRRLEREGHRVELADSGRAALNLLRSRRMDLVLLDVMMPEVDGFEVLRQLKSDESLRDIPVLMISALDEIDSVVRCIELGAEDYLPKPFDPVLLRARIGACLEKKRLRDRETQHLRELADWNQKLEQRVAEQVALVDRLGRLKRFFSPQLAELIVGRRGRSAQDASP